MNVELVKSLSKALQAQYESLDANVRLSVTHLLNENYAESEKAKADAELDLSRIIHTVAQIKSNTDFEKTLKKLGYVKAPDVKK